MMRSLKNTVLLTALILFISCTAEQIQQTLDTIGSGGSAAPLTNREVGSGLKEALIQGISKGSNQASRLDGFFKNPQIKIPFPPEVQKVENTLRDIGLGNEVDKFVLQLNRGAEKAAVGAKSIFVNAIKSLTIQDAFAILKGEPNAATNFLRRTTSEQLKAQFLPVISRSLNEVNATKYYGDIIGRYNKVPFVQKVNPDLNDYAADRAIAGLFTLIEKEEANIRANPAARASDLLKRVFGSLN